MDAVSVYLDKILQPALLGFGVSKVFCSYICETVGNQMYSLLKHWDDIAFRKTVLFIGMEEGLYYQPDAKIEVKAFVVTTLRNSPFETLQSVDFARTGLNKELSVEQIKQITSQAIHYFSKQDFSALCKYAKANFAGDYYNDILQAHPVAKMALEKIANCPAKSISFDRVNSERTYERVRAFVGPRIADSCYSKNGATVLDGYSKEIDTDLANLLNIILDKKASLSFFHSFKHVTRNFEKLVSIIEFILANDAAFVTPNVYLENGYAERRTTPLKLPHGKKKSDKKELKLNELAHKHTAALNFYLKNCQ